MKCAECGAVRPAIKPPTLSARQIEVLTLLASGMDAPAVARTLFLGLNTVYQHTKRIRRFCGVSTTREAVAKAQSWGLI